MGANTKIAEPTCILFFDGVCNLCHSSVNFIIDRDEKGKISFASLQSDYAKRVLGQEIADLDQTASMILLKEGEIYKKSTAALTIARQLNGLWPVLYVLMVIPRFIRDFFYDVIAKNRYRWFGKKDHCRISAPELAERFLDSY